MESTSEIAPQKASIKDYLIYAALGGIIHPMVGGVFSLLLAGLDALYIKYVSNEMGVFALAILLGASPPGIFVCLPMFISTGIFYSVVFGLIYNATSHGKANSPSNRVLYNVLFSLAMAVIGPIGVFITLQILTLFSS